MMLHIHLCNGMLSVQVSQVKSARRLVKYDEGITINITKQSGIITKHSSPQCCEKLASLWSRN